MSEDWYAFNGLPNDKTERARKFKRDNKCIVDIQYGGMAIWPYNNADNEDWEIIINEDDLSKDRDLNIFDNRGLS